MTHTIPILMLALAAAGAGAQTPPRDLSKQPPRVESAVAHVLAQPSAAGNARVEVRMASDEQLPPLIPVDLETGKAILRDDGRAGDVHAGDRVYSAIVPLDLAAISRNQARLAKLRNTLGKPLAMPVFDGRTRTGRLVLPDDFFKPIVPGSDVPLERWGFPQALAPEKSILIRDSSVVDNPDLTYDACAGTGTPMGKWTFGFLMSQLANEPFTGLQPAEFVRRWIEISRTRQTINGLTNHPFPLNWDDLIENWPTQKDGSLDLARAPFRLLAIVNRIDLRDNLVYGGSNAGEARFVFGFRRCDFMTVPSAISPPMTVIFEFGIRKSGCIPLKGWAQQWQALSAPPLGSAAYLAVLEAITDQFSLANAAPSKPNRSALNQLRVNGGLSAAAWEMREFRLPGKGAVTSDLALTTVKQTPDSRMLYLDPVVLTDYVNGATADIVAGGHVVPNTFMGVPIISGVADSSPFPNGWNLPDVVNREARHLFALQTCNGCHLRETGTGDFFHIGPALPGTPAPLSGFMTGIDVADPFDRMPVRHFNELERRAADLDSVANSVCIAFVDPNQRFGNLRLRLPIPLQMEH